ncbi:MAG TPA: peptidoglycan-binding domain-containing protein, partial [Polyangiaceae bacterium]
TAECGDHMYYGKTDGDGMLELELPIAGDELLIWIAGQARTLLLGQLNPIDDAPDEGVSGVQGRLVGLGFDAGAADGKLGPKTAAALIAFQRHYGLKLSGEADPNTIAKLKKEYRS